jgi:hypothetical protein
MATAEKKNHSKGKIAVLVVHGVNAKVPDTEFSNLEAVTDLLVNHDFIANSPLKACWLGSATDDLFTTKIRWRVMPQVFSNRRAHCSSLYDCLPRAN